MSSRESRALGAHGLTFLLFALHKFFPDRRRLCLGIDSK
jgi:hypothetical protein